jgi:hypothetical protein
MVIEFASQLFLLGYFYGIPMRFRVPGSGIRRLGLRVQGLGV